MQSTPPKSPWRKQSSVDPIDLDGHLNHSEMVEFDIDRNAVNRCKLDPAAFYTELSEVRRNFCCANAPSSTTDSINSYIPAYLNRSTIASLVNSLYRDKRREARVQGLEDVVVLFAVPMLKRDGRPNRQWINCEIVCDDLGPRAMVPRMHDPINGDMIFSFVRSAEPKGKQRVMKFYLRSGDDIDRPAKAGFYELPVDTPGLYSIRDGEVTKGDKIFDLGILINLVLPLSLSMDVPTLHYFDESCGRWGCRNFIVKTLDGHSKPDCLDYVCVLSGLRRTHFVIQAGNNEFIRGTDGHDVFIAWPGSYTVIPQRGVEGELRALLTSESILDLSFAVSVPRCVAAEASPTESNQPTNTFAICEFDVSD